MRTAGIRGGNVIVVLIVGLGLLPAFACTGNTSPDEVCASVDGVCIPEGNTLECGDQLVQPCSTGYICCTGTGTDAAPTSSDSGSSASSGTGTGSSGSGS